MQKKKKSKKEDKANLVIPFISDVCNKKIMKLMKKCEINGNLVTKPNVTLEKFTRKKNLSPVDKCVCYICKEIGPKYTCGDRHLVYQYTCKICGEKYIGKSSRPFKIRHQEHKSSVKNKTVSSALAQHDRKHQISDIEDYSIQILSKKMNSRDITIEESKYIRERKPEINRKFELNHYPIFKS